MEVRDKENYVRKVNSKVVIVEIRDSLFQLRRDWCMKLYVMKLVIVNIVKCA